MNYTGLMKRGRLFVFVLLFLSLFAALLETTEVQAAYPTGIASLGDSITRGFNTGSVPFTDAPGNSWSTGDNGSVNSLYLRIRAANPAINGRNFNFAKTGARMGDLVGQVNSINQNVDFVTVLLGANDVCASSVGTMTAVETYRTQFQQGLAAIKDKLPSARIFVASIPNIYNLWSVLKGNFWARFVWGVGSICPSMLANPTSTAGADVTRRNTVKQRNIDLNTVLQTECANVAGCRFDGNAVFNTVFSASDVSTRDYFHPSVSGQAKLANVTFAAAGLP
jgi:lysophospholipase L1-like esterase